MRELFGRHAQNQLPVGVCGPATDGGLKTTCSSRSRSTYQPEREDNWRAYRTLTIDCQWKRFEVLSEEACDEGERQEHRADNGQPFHDFIRPLRRIPQLCVANVADEFASGFNGLMKTQRVVVDIPKVDRYAISDQALAMLGKQGQDVSLWR